MPLAERALWSVMLAVWAVGITTLTWEHRKPGWLLFALIMTEWARSFARAGDAVKIRVLEVLPTLKRAGAENVALSLASRLDSDRFETVWSPCTLPTRTDSIAQRPHLVPR